MSIVSLGRTGLPMCEPSKQRFNASQRKQNLVVQRRKSYLSGKDQDQQYFSIEELLNRIPFQCMVNPYITRLVNFHELWRYVRFINWKITPKWSNVVWAN